MDGWSRLGVSDVEVENEPSRLKTDQEECEGQAIRGQSDGGTSGGNPLALYVDVWVTQCVQYIVYENEM